MPSGHPGGSRSSQREQVVAGNNNWATSVLGATSDYLTARDLTLGHGSSFTVQDVESAAKVAILGKTVVDNLFAGGDPLGQIIRSRNVPFTVIGVLSPKGQSPTGQDQDDFILIPLSTAKKKVLGISQANAGAVGSIMTQATGIDAIDMAQNQIHSLLRQRHHL